ncbi:hypothetical protein FHW84_001786 [Dyella sp. SG562]|uniref:DUF7666 domain-containing protein n=1 Tax=Dyella sp. SG562 TaxID=2587017 RepID=UPI001FB8D332|nr:hypothetical protein [Dyella sp. SG562]NII73217.1 hypothetical protein [Dyella sp. SG562]
MTSKTAAKKAAPKVETSLVLRVCREDFTSHSGFVWPSEVGAEVLAPDWKENNNCGNGLHGWLYGQGDVTCVDHWERAGAKWLVLEVESATIVMLGGKVKFPRAVVRFVGDRQGAAAFVLEHESRAKAENLIGHAVHVGDGQVAAVGSLGTATAGDSGTATAGDSGTATAGYRGTATAGYRGTATAGDSGTATAGDSGTATAGDSGTATAGDSGELRIHWWDAKAERYRTQIAYVGENGIKPNVAYRLNEKREFVEVAP